MLEQKGASYRNPTEDLIRASYYNIVVILEHTKGFVLQSHEPAEPHKGIISQYQAKPNIVMSWAHRTPEGHHNIITISWSCQNKKGPRIAISRSCRTL